MYRLVKQLNGLRNVWGLIMGNLPSPEIFQTFEMHFVDGGVPIKDTKDIDLMQYDKALKLAALRNDRGYISTKLYELIHPIILGNDVEKTRGIMHHFIGYSKKHNTLSISLYDSDEVAQTIALRHAIDKDGNSIKWKTYGSKSFLPYWIDKSPLVFTASGMAEVLLFELFGFDYFLLQSDGIVRTLATNTHWKAILPLLNGKLVIYLLDNDESSKDAFKTFQGHYLKSISIDFEMMWDRDLPHGYDFRDFCNQIAREFEGKSLECKSKVCQTIIVSIFLEVEKQLRAAKGVNNGSH